MGDDGDSFLGRGGERSKQDRKKKTGEKSFTVRRAKGQERNENDDGDGPVIRTGRFRARQHPIVKRVNCLRGEGVREEVRDLAGTASKSKRSRIKLFKGKPPRINAIGNTGNVSTGTKEHPTKARGIELVPFAGENSTLQWQYHLI